MDYDSFIKHTIIFLSGSTALGIVAHAVSTFPTPKNIYGQWFLGVVKFIVGQRISGANALQGMQTAVLAVTNDQKTLLANGSSLKVVDDTTGVVQESIPKDKIIIHK